MKSTSIAGIVVVPLRKVGRGVALSVVSAVAPVASFPRSDHRHARHPC